MTIRQFLEKTFFNVDKSTIMIFCNESVYSEAFHNKSGKTAEARWRHFSRHRINENNYFIAFVQIFIEHQMFDFKITQDENRCVIQTKTGTYIFIAATEILLTYMLMGLFNSAPAH